MPNRAKTKRNKKILEYAEKGYRHAAIGRMYKLPTGTVSVIIHRERQKAKGEGNDR